MPQDLDALSPVERIATDPAEDRPAEGLALCLSGGGYRAMLFHLGALWRLNELGYLPRLDRVSSVSGGSITAGVLGLHWGDLGFDAAGVGGRFQASVVEPVRGLASKTIDAGAIIEGILTPGESIADEVAEAYRDRLFGRRTLQDLPERPRFVINATNVQSLSLWRFSRPYMRDYRVGEVRNPTVELAVAVAASSAFPPVLSPLVLELEESDFTPGSGELQRPPFTTKVVLTDGGVYDNLGLETAWKRHRTILVSDGGGRTEFEPEPKRDWARHTYRILNVIDNQVRSLRKRQVIGSFKAGARRGAYWGIRTEIAKYGLDDALDCPVDKTTALANTATRLKALSGEIQERLINWGYAVCDAAMRAHVDRSLPRPSGFPFPGAALG